MYKIMVAAFVIAAPLFASPANAQLTYVSATGNDANTCFVEASPCKTLQRGINQTAAGGELRVLSQVISSGFINKSMTIDAEGQAIVGSFIVNGASAIVTFRRIVLTGRGVYPTGFDIRNATAVHIEDSTAERFTGDGVILAQGVSTKLFVSRSVLRDNGGAGLAVAGPTSATLTVDNSRFADNGGYGLNIGGSKVSVTDSISSDNGAGIRITAGVMNVTRTTVTDSFYSGFLLQGGETNIESSVVHGNNNFGLYADPGAFARISNTAFTNNGTGISNSGGSNLATIETTENNMVRGNTQNLAGDLTEIGAGI